MIEAARRESQLERTARQWSNDTLSLTEPAWMTQRRQLAWKYFEQNGIPTIRQENFRFLPLASITSEALQPVLHADLGATLNRALSPHAAAIGFIDGHPVGSVSELPAGLKIERLGQLLRDEPDALEPYLSNPAAPIHAFAAVSLSMFRDAWIVRVAAGVSIELPIDVVVQQGSGGHWVCPRLLIVLAPNSRLKVIERHVASEATDVGLTTGVFEFSLAEGSHLDHVRLCSGGSKAAELSATSVRVAARAHYNTWVATNGGMLSRFDTHVHLVGSEARADLDGLYVARGKDIIDHHTLVVHECVNTTVQESYRGIVDDEAQAVFDGQIQVKPGAMGTNAQQYNRNLLLSDRAVVHTKPQLEIDADDVACSHGATVGKLDDQQLFYLQSRGISGKRAKQMLTTAFAAELIDRCPIEQALVYLPGQVDLPFSNAEPMLW